MGLVLRTSLCLLILILGQTNVANGAALAAGEYMPYDTATGVGILYNAGATAVDVTVVDGGGALALDSFVIDLDTAGAVSLVATDTFTGVGGFAVIDSADATLTLTTGVAVADSGTLSAAIGVGHLDGADPGNNAAVAAAGGDVTGIIDLDNGASTLTALLITDGGTGTGAFSGAVITDGDVGAVSVAGNIAGGTWTVGGQLTGAWTVGGNIDAASDITVASGTTAAADINVAGDLAGDIVSSTLAGDIIVTGNINSTITSANSISGNISGSHITGAIIATNGNISGNITATNGNLSGNISAKTAITGVVSTTNGDLLGNVKASTGSIDNIILGGAGEVSAVNGNLTIQATGGSVTLTANGLDSNGNDITILGDTGVTVSVATIAADNADTISIDGGSSGSTTVTSLGVWTQTGTGVTNVNGDDIIINSGGSTALNNITASNNITVTILGNLITNDITATNDITNVHATGTLTTNNIMAVAGDIASLTSGSTMVLNDVTAGDDITSIVSSGSLALNDASATDVTAITSADGMTVNTVNATTGNVVNVEADTDGDGGVLTITTLISATAGEVTNVEGTGITGNITATAGKVVEVDASSGGFNGVINSNVATTASALLTVIASNVIYTVESDATAAQAEYDLTYVDDGAGGNDPGIDIEIKLLSGSGWDLSLKSNFIGGFSDTEIDLRSLSFKPTTTNRSLGVVTVEGDVIDTLNLEGALPNNSSMEALIVQDNLLTNSTTQRVLVGALSMVTAANIGGVAATATLADQATEIFGGGAPTASTLSATYILPVGTSGIVQVFAPGAAAFSPTSSLIGFEAGPFAREVSMQLIAGTLGNIGDVPFGALFVPANFPTIQDAINASLDGATIIVSDGIYSGPGNVDLNFLGKAITVKSDNGPDFCIIDCQGSSTVFHQGFVFDNGEDANSIINGFTIQNGWHDFGGAIYCENSSPVVEKCILINNNANAYGGAVYCLSSDPNIINCEIFNNNSLFGGGVSCWFNSYLNITQSVIANNFARTGGAIYSYNSEMNINNCTLANNTGDTFGGAISSWLNSNVTLSDSILWGNISSSGNQVALGDTANPSFILISYCNLQGLNSGVYLEGASNATWGLGNLNVDPLFANPGSKDFHLKSQGWRWDRLNQQWTWDSVTSLCVDAGKPGIPLADEPETLNIDPLNQFGINIRRNMGAYGGTSTASIPPHNWVLLSDVNNDGIVNETDLMIFQSDWLRNLKYLSVDFNRDDKVNLHDFNIISTDWREPTSWHQ